MFVKEWLERGCRFVYPPSCLHCGSLDLSENRHFCSSCLELFHPLRKGTVANPHPFDGVAASFDYLGPARTLVSCMKYQDMPYLAPVAAAYLALQLTSLSWPWPDIIIAVPQNFLRKMSRGYNQSALLAEELSKITGVPFCHALKRRGGGFSQAGLSYTMRRELSDRFFSLKRGVDLKGKNCLLIDDVVTTGSTISCCAQKLIEANPKALYALTVCRTKRVL